MHPEPPRRARQGDSRQERRTAEEQRLQPGHVMQGA
jgi:hypothetical protein